MVAGWIIATIVALVVGGAGTGVLSWAIGRRGGANDAYEEILSMFSAGSIGGGSGFLSSLFTNNIIWIIVIVVGVFLIMRWMSKRR